MMDFNQVMSLAFREFHHKFSALACPTFSKQETVTSLYKSIQASAENENKPPFPWRRLLEFAPRLLLMFGRILYASQRFRVRRLPEGAIVFRTWLVPRSFVRAELVDDYFRKLPEDLAAYESVVVSFTSTDVGLLNHFGRAKRGDNQIISYGLLSVLDVVSLFWNYMFTAYVQTRQKYHLNGRDVSAYINHSLLLDYLGLRSFEAYAEKYKCEKLIQHRIKAFVYIFENQSWEKTCCATLRGHDIRLIGYQSSGFSPIFLNFFPTDLDSHQHPMPDVLLTVGEYFRKYLLEHGHYAIPIESFAALRFSYPCEGGFYTVLPANQKILGRILYAFPVHIDQYADTISDLVQVFGGSGIAVELKLHPLYRLSDVKALSRIPENFQIVTDVDMDCLRDNYDCVLFNDNSFGIEALLKGVKSYQYSRDGSFSDDRFMYFDLWQVNYQLADLRQLKDSIQSGSYDKKFDLEAVIDYINGMYRSYTQKRLDWFREILKTASAAD